MIARLRELVGFLSNSWGSSPSSASTGTADVSTSSTAGDLAEAAGTVLPTGGNSIACGSISSKIAEVTDAAESLDMALGRVQDAMDHHAMEVSAVGMDKKSEHLRTSSADDLSCSMRSTEDESYATASEYNSTMHSSQASSYHTASEHRTSPWWSLDKNSIDECSELSAEIPQTPQTSESPDIDRGSNKDVRSRPKTSTALSSPSEDHHTSDESAIFLDVNDSDENEGEDQPVPEYEGDRATLIIPEAYPKDAGVYLATAKNIAGEAYSTCNVTVKGRLPNETSDSEMASDMEPIKPSVQLPLKDVSVFEGKSVRLDCVIIGQPEPEVIWYHNERPVKESADVQLLFQGDRCSLVIQEAYLEDAGSYKVVAINSAGEASSSCNLSVTPLNINEHATRLQAERLIPVESPPKFEKFLTDVLANEGDTVELECSVIGGDLPLSVKWYLSNKEISESDRLRFSSEPGGVFKLIISRVSADDKGVYTVKVSNSSGDAKCFSHLIVKSVNAPDNQQRQPQLELEERLICPTFKELFSDKNARPDESVKFECIVVGKPTPKIRWFFNDEPVHGKHFLVSTSGDRQVLTVQAACPETVGKIACIAENEIGKATCVANLGLMGQGILQQPSDFVDVQNMTQEHHTGSSLVTIKKQMFTSTSTSQVDAVQNGIPHTQFHGNIQSIDQDMKQFGDHKPEIRESHEYKEFRSTDSAPVTVEEKSIVVVHKPADDIEPPPHKIVRKQIAPRFMSPLIGKIVDQGAEVNLVAIYDGFPSPEIKVQKNGEELLETDRVKIIKELNKVQISLNNVSVRDAGRYSITVSNSVGTSTSTADVVVKKTIFPPVFGHRLQAQVAKRGERVIMDVEVTGTPEPTITWYKDSRPLKEVLKSEFKLKDEGNSHSLIIEKVQTGDSGKYMVKATNAGGEAQSIADFVVLEPTPERMVEVVKTVVYDDMKDFKQEIPKPESDSFYTKSVETSSKNDAHSLSESTVITEHRRTTEATMRLEHKASFLDLELPKLSKPAPIAPTENHDFKSFIMNTEMKQTKTEIPSAAKLAPQPTAPAPQPAPTTNENSSIETSSITKKSAFEFFKSIQTEPTTTTPQDKYMKYEDIKRASPAAPKVTPTTSHKVPTFNATTNATPPVKPVTPIEKPSVLQNGFPNFDLTPGPPPEYGFIPSSESKSSEHITEHIKKIEETHKSSYETPNEGLKTQPIPPKQTESVPITSQSFKPKPDTRAGEHIADRIKKLEESQKTNVEAPNGGVRTFPDITKREEHTMYSKESTYEFSSGPIYRPQASLPPPLLPSDRAQSPKPSAEAIAMEKLWASPKPFEHERFHLERDQESQSRKQFSCTESDSEFQQMEEIVRRGSIKETKQIFEEKIKQASKDEELKAPALVKQFCPTPAEPLKPIPETLMDIHLEPGTPPEICYAPKPPEERRQSLVEAIEQKLEKDLTKEPTKVPPHSDYSSSSVTKNISMTTKNVKEVTQDESQLEPFPFKPDPPRARPIKVPPPPSPSKFVKGEFRESDYGSDYEEKIPPVWKPYDSDSSDRKAYRPIRPVLTPTGRRSAQSIGGESPVPPTQFDNPPRFEGPPRPKFEPIKQEEPVKIQPQSHVYKPKPVQARFVPTQQEHTPPQRPNFTTQYYTAVAGTPFHNASMATETSKSVQMKESSETCHRVVNMSQTHRVIHFDNKKSSQETQLEPFRYIASPTFTSSRSRVQLPTPTKFKPGEFRESDYESEVDGAQIRPVWTPNPSDNEGKHYRHVDPPRPSRSTSLPRSYDRVMTPMEFDTHPPEMPKNNVHESTTFNQGQKSNTMRHYSTQRTYNTRTTRDDMNLKIGSPPKNDYTSQVNHQVKDLSSTFRSKTSKFIEDVSNDLKSPHIVRPGFKRAPSEGDNKPHAYREESRVSQYGTKHIDPDTGLVYFKYDFGYEFGIIFPGEGKKIIGGMRNNALSESSSTKPTQLRSTPTINYKGDIIIPVQHERTSSSRSVSRQNGGFTSEGEFSEPEYDGHAKKRYSLPIDINIDRLHSTDMNNFISRKPGISVTENGTSSVPVNAHLYREERPKRPPIFITPLKDIAVVMGQTARFECIVQCDPHPQITWLKNGYPLEASNKHVIEFRNGVCRLTIPEAFPDDAATYTCQGVNELGTAATSADLFVPGNKCGVRY